MKTAKLLTALDNQGNAMKNLKPLFAFCFIGLLLSTPLLASAGEFCFGGAGQGCGTFAGGPFGSVAFCLPNNSSTRKNVVCQVSGGSMTHDPCCVMSPSGVFCGRSPSTNQCKVEWDRAVNRWFWGYNWKRNVDSRKENTTGQVVFNDYCAPNTAGIHKNDQSYCCSKKSLPASNWDRAGRPNLNVCVE
jgi:hypothetical protein